MDAIAPADPVVNVELTRDTSLTLDVSNPQHAVIEGFKRFRVALQVVLSFYESRRKQPWALGFGAQEERLFWEQWYSPTPVLDPSPRS